MPSKRTPAVDPRINVSVPFALRSKARKKAESQGKNMGELIVGLLKEYVKKAA